MKLTPALTAAQLEATDTITEVYFAPSGIRIGITTARGQPTWGRELTGVTVPFEKLLPIIEEAYAAKIKAEEAEKAAIEKARAEAEKAAAETPKP